VVPKIHISCVHNEDSNWVPLSVVMMDRVPNLEFHPETTVQATEGAVISDRGKASGHLVNLSTHVSR
jgi:hypothetical protein